MLSIKVILIGDSRVGKTCVIEQYINKQFLEENISARSSDKFYKEVKVGEKTVKLEIWDTPGAEQYRSVIKIYMKNAKIVLMVYDMTVLNSFNNLKNWYKELKDINNSVEVFGVIANKSDLYEESVINKEEGENYAKTINATFYETSALDYDSVAAAFEGLTKEYVQKKDKEDRKREEEEQKKIKLEPSKYKEEKEKDQNHEKGASIRRCNIF